MPQDRQEPELYSARLFFTGWPHCTLECPVCHRENMSLVSIRLCRGRRGTVIDAAGIHVNTEWEPGAWLALVFRCSAHESVLNMAPDGEGRLTATVESLPSARAFVPLWDELLPRQPPSTARLTLVRHDRERRGN